MKSLPLVLLIAASALLLSQTGQSYDQPQCCKSRWCNGCACRRVGYKYTEEELETLRKHLEDNSTDSNEQLETSEGAPDYTIENPETSDSSEYNTLKAVSAEDDGDDIIRKPSNKKDSQLDIVSSNTFAALNPINCLLCKIAHC